MKLEGKTYHNAGHAVATALIEAGHEQACENAAHRTRWNAEYEAMTALGGVIAERIFLGVVEPTGAKNDIENAFRHVSTLTSVPREQAAYVRFLNARVEYLLERHRDFIEYVASNLESAGGQATTSRDRISGDLSKLEET